MIIDSNTASIMFANNIFIKSEEGSPSDFVKRVQDALKKIDSQEVGHRLLTKIQQGKHQISIKYSVDVNEAKALNSPLHAIRDQGCGTEIKISYKDESVLGFNAEKIEFPFFIKLAHEIIHACHNSYGKNKSYLTSCDDKKWSNDEEYQAIVSFTPKVSKRRRPKICENEIRKEHHLPLRYSHLAYELTNEKMRDELKQSALVNQTMDVFHQMLQRNPNLLPRIAKAESSDSNHNGSLIGAALKGIQKQTKEIKEKRKRLK